MYIYIYMMISTSPHPPPLAIQYRDQTYTATAVETETLCEMGTQRGRREDTGHKRAKRQKGTGSEDLSAPLQLSSILLLLLLELACTAAGFLGQDLVSLLLDRCLHVLRCPVSVSACAHVTCHMSHVTCHTRATCLLVCMHPSMHACMHISMHACIYPCTHARMHARVHACTHTCIHACMHTCMYACIHARMPGSQRCRRRSLWPARCQGPARP